MFGQIIVEVIIIINAEYSLLLDRIQKKKIEIDSNNNPIEFTFSIYIGRERKLIKRKIL